MFITEDELDALTGHHRRRGKAIAAWLISIALLLAGCALARWLHGPLPRWVPFATGPFVVLSRFVWEGIFGVYPQKRPLRR
jgi:hypothetical protein